MGHIIVARLPCVAESRRRKNLSPCQFARDTICILPILGYFCRFLHISAGFSHTVSHTESGLLGNSPDAECESRGPKSQRPSGNSIPSPGTHNHPVFSPDEILGRDTAHLRNEAAMMRKYVRFLPCFPLCTRRPGVRYHAASPGLSPPVELRLQVSDG